jgi:hypothetical protein
MILRELNTHMEKKKLNNITDATRPLASDVVKLLLVPIPAMEKRNTPCKTAPQIRRTRRPTRSLRGMPMRTPTHATTLEMMLYKKAFLERPTVL